MPELFKDQATKDAYIAGLLAAKYVVFKVEKRMTAYHAVNEYKRQIQEIIDVAQETKPAG